MPPPRCSVFSCQRGSGNTMKKTSTNMSNCSVGRTGAISSAGLIDSTSPTKSPGEVALAVTFAVAFWRPGNGHTRTSCACAREKRKVDHGPTLSARKRIRKCRGRYSQLEQVIGSRLEAGGLEFTSQNESWSGITTALYRSKIAESDSTPVWGRTSGREPENQIALQSRPSKCSRGRAQKNSGVGTKQALDGKSSAISKQQISSDITVLIPQSCGPERKRARSQTDVGWG